VVAPQGKKVRIAVVDDHESVRLGLQAAFTNVGFEFVLAAATVPEFVEGLGSGEVDVVVLDSPSATARA